MTSFTEIIDVNVVAVRILCAEFQQHSEIDSVQNGGI